MHAVLGVVFGLAASLAGSAAMADTVLPPPPSVTPAPQAPPLSIWSPMPGEGFEHLQSGLVCPARVAGYGRGLPVFFNDYGLDVGCDYTTPSRTVSIYLTQLKGAKLEAVMDAAKHDLLQVGVAKHPTLLSETASTLGGLAWKVATYGEDGDLHSAIWLADLHGWTFEFRATYPKAEESAVQADLAKMTDTVIASAGAKLAACEKAPAVERKGDLITDAKEISSEAMMSSILGGAAMMAVQEGKGEKTELVLWCVDTTLKQATGAMMFWRGVHPNGSDAQTDQVTLMTQDAPPALTASADSMAALMDNLSKKNAAEMKGPHWSATLTTTKQVLIFGYFNDRPTPARLADLFDQVLSGKAKAVGGYSVNGKNINITVPSSK